MSYLPCPRCLRLCPQDVDPYCVQQFMEDTNPLVGSTAPFPSSVAARTHVHGCHSPLHTCMCTVVTPHTHTSCARWSPPLIYMHVHGGHPPPTHMHSRCSHPPTHTLHAHGSHPPSHKCMRMVVTPPHTHACARWSSPPPTNAFAR